MVPSLRTYPSEVVHLAIHYERDRVLVGLSLEPRTLTTPGSGSSNKIAVVRASRLPIVMLADRATMGGYPKIATVIGADLPRLAQLLPGTGCASGR
jgi:allophanate hydrolase subunit 2